MDNKVKPRAGFTLSEVIVGLGLLSVAILAIMAVFLGTLPYMSQNRETATATGLARGFHEQMLAQGGIPCGYVFDGATGDPTLNAFPPDPYPKVEVEGVPYTFKIRTFRPAGSPLTNFVEVEVEVGWGAGRHLSQSCRYYVP